MPDAFLFYILYVIIFILLEIFHENQSIEQTKIQKNGFVLFQFIFHLAFRSNCIMGNGIFGLASL